MRKHAFLEYLVYIDSRRHLDSYDIALYMYGHDHIRVKRLASMYVSCSGSATLSFRPNSYYHLSINTCGSASMSGLTVKREVIADHERRYGQYLRPRWESLRKDGTGRASTITRSENLGAWVLDELRCEGRQMQVSPRLP